MTKIEITYLLIRFNNNIYTKLYIQVKTFIPSRQQSISVHFIRNVIVTAGFNLGQLFSKIGLKLMKDFQLI